MYYYTNNLATKEVIMSSSSQVTVHNSIFSNNSGSVFVAKEYSTEIVYSGTYINNTDDHDVSGVLSITKSSIANISNSLPTIQ